MNILLISIVVLLPGLGQCCSAYCVYAKDSSHAALCINELATGCTACDNLLFVLDPPNASPSGSCVPHLSNNQYLDITVPAYTIYSGSRILSGANTQMYFQCCGTASTAFASHSVVNPHFALRLRFRTERSTSSANYFAFRYGMDDQLYSFSQPTSVYSTTIQIVTTPLYNHTISTVGTAFLLDSCGTCSGHTFFIREVMIFVSRCSLYCTMCTSLTVCSNCSTLGNGTQTYLYKNQCYIQCPQTTFADLLNLLNGIVTQPQPSCSPCPVLCQQCSSLLICLACYREGRNESYLFNGMCYASCPAGFLPEYVFYTCVCPAVSYFTTLALGVPILCTACSVECLTCTDATNLGCPSCKPSYYLAYSTTHCLITCPHNQYVFQSTNLCYLCNVHCASCFGLSTNCTSCTASYLLNNVCLQTCPLGYSMNNLTFVCQLCTPFTYSFNGQCLASCPPYYMPLLSNASCLPLSATDYRLNTSIDTIQLLNYGKTLHFFIHLTDGLNATSQNFILNKAYSNIAILVTPSRLLHSQRQLQAVLPTTMNVLQSVSIQSINLTPNTIQFYTSVPTLFPSMQFTVSYSTNLYSLHNIPYQQLSLSYTLPQHVFNQYITSNVQNFFNLIPLFCLLLLFILFVTRVPTTSSLLIQSIRYVQLGSLLVYSLTQTPLNIFYFLLGSDYANMGFLPNIYVLIAQPQVNGSLASYVLYTPGMDFLRLLGGIIIFIAGSLIALLLAFVCFKAQASTLKWIAYSMWDVLQVKILYAFWTSLIYIILQSTTQSFSLYFIHFISYFFLAAILFTNFQYQSKAKKIFFFYRICTTLIIALINYYPLLLCTILSLVSFLTTVSIVYNIRHPTITNQFSEDIDHSHPSDNAVKFSTVLIVRNYFVAALPLCTSLVVGAVVLLRTYEIGVTLTLILVLVCICIINVIIYAFSRQFIKARNAFTVQSEIDIVKVNYDAVEETIISPQRRRRNTDQTHQDQAVNQKFRKRQNIAIGNQESKQDQLKRSNTNQSQYNVINQSPRIKKSISTRNNQNVINLIATKKNQTFE